MGITTDGKYIVADRVVAMPCVVRDASAGTATFDIATAGARGLVPAAFDIAETTPGRCQLTLAVIDYRDNDLGPYREVGITFFVRPAGTEDDGGEVGTYIHRLPVDDGFSCEAGRTIWGFPKTVDEIGFAYGDTSVTVTLTVDSELALRLTIPRAGDDEMPQMPMSTYTILDGTPHAVAFSQGGTGSQVGDGTGVTLELGEHPIGRELAALGLPTTPAFTTWTERMQATFDGPRPLEPASQ
jgi:Acetoacetate decarboxylase (ADC)